MKLLPFLLAAALPLAAQAQPASGPKKLTIYLAADGSQLPGPDGADHRADISLRDSVSGTVKEYFPSGKLRRMASYAHVPHGIRHGVELSYDEAGTLRRRQEFVGGQRQGELQVFDKEGKLSRKVAFDQDKKTGQQCFTAAGEPRECKPEKVLPEFAGGTPGLARAIEAAVVMPHEDLARQRFGTVLLRFVVDQHGRVAGATFEKAAPQGNSRIQPPSLAMQQAALAALGTVRFASSGMVDGEPVSVLYSLPVRVGKPASGYATMHDTNVTEYQGKTTFLEGE